MGKEDCSKGKGMKEWGGRKREREQYLRGWGGKGKKGQGGEEGIQFTCSMVM